MATSVGSHPIGTFIYPVNGTSPIDADEVKANDNALRSAYVAHDADSGIHVQSSPIAFRPSAGQAGRKWITADAGQYILWYDDGVRWHEVSNTDLSIEFIASAAIVKGDVLKLTGWNNGQNLPELAPLTSASDVAFAIATETVANGAKGYAINNGFIEDVDTDLFNVGDMLYPSSTTGPGTITSWFTTAKPSSGSYQLAAYVIRKNSSNGVLFVEFSAPAIVESSANTANNVVRRDGSGNFSAGTITAALTGNVTGNLTGNVTGNVAGNLTGNVVGNVTGDVSGNAGTATALQTARTIWGQSFNGTGNVSGNISGVGTTQFNGVTYSWPGTSGTNGYVLTTNGTGTLSWTNATPNTIGALSDVDVSSLGDGYLLVYDGGTGFWDSSNSISISSVSATEMFVGGRINFNGSATLANVGLTRLNTTDDLVLRNTSADVVLQTSAGRALEAVGGTQDVVVYGALSKGSGSFRIRHPLPELEKTHDLVHSFIEGPYCDLIYRGSVELLAGSARVDLDKEFGMTEGTFEVLNGNVQVFLQNDTGWEPVRGSVAGSILSIGCRDASSRDIVSWMVIGERRDPNIKSANWTDENGRPILEPVRPAPPEESE